MVLQLRQEAVHSAQLRVLCHGPTLSVVIQSLDTYGQQPEMDYTHAVIMSGVHPLSPVISGR